MTTLRGGGARAKGHGHGGRAGWDACASEGHRSEAVIGQAGSGPDWLAELGLSGGAAWVEGVGSGYSGNGRRVGQKDLN